MKFIFLFVISVSGVAAGEYDYSHQVESAFKKYFDISVYDAEAYISGVEIIGDKISDDPSGIPILLKFNMNKKVDKILLLKADGNYYSNTGRYSGACAKAPVSLYSYMNKDKIYQKELKISIKTACTRHPIVLLLWVKTMDGEFYQASFPFYTTTSSTK